MYNLNDINQISQNMTITPNTTDTIAFYSTGSLPPPLFSPPKRIIKSPFQAMCFGVST